MLFAVFCVYSLSYCVLVVSLRISSGVCIYLQCSGVAAVVVIIVGMRAAALYSAIVCGIMAMAAAYVAA